MKKAFIIFMLLLSSAFADTDSMGSVADKLESTFTQYNHGGTKTYIRTDQYKNLDLYTLRKIAAVLTKCASSIQDKYPKKRFNISTIYLIDQEIKNGITPATYYSGTDIVSSIRVSKEVTLDSCVDLIENGAKTKKGLKHFLY